MFNKQKHQEIGDVYCEEIASQEVTLIIIKGLVPRICVEQDISEGLPILIVMKHTL